MTARPTPALPFRVVRADAATPDNVPRNCLCLMPTVGGNSQRLLGYDADGEVWIDAEVRLDYWAIEGLQRLVTRESKQWEPRARLPLLPLRLVP